MKNKLIIWGLILAASVVVLPATTLASSEKTNNIANYEHSVSYAPPYSFQRRGRRGRGRGSDDHLEGGHRSRHHARRSSHHARRSHHRTRTVRQVYYRNGRRHVRYIRVHN